MRLTTATMPARWRLVLLLLAGLLPLPGGGAAGQAWAQHAVEQIVDPEIQYRHALGLLRREFYDLSEPQFRLFLEKFPGHDLSASAEYYLIQCLRYQGKTAEMVSALREFRQKRPRHPELETLTLLEADTLFGSGDYAGAAGLYRLLAQSRNEPRGEQARYFLAQCLVRTGQAEEALALYRELSALPLQQDRAYRFYAQYHLAWIHQQQNRFAEAEAGFARLADHESTPEALRADTLYRLGEMRMHLQQHDSALAAFDRYVVQYPDGEFGSTVRRRRIAIHALNKDYGRCLELLQDWRAKYPSENDFEMDYLHGQCLMAKNQVQEAIPFFVRVGADPGVPATTRRYARLQAIRCQLQAGQHAAALASIGAFLEEYPKTPEKGHVLICQGQAADATGKADEAEQAFRAAMSFFADDLENYQIAGEHLVQVLSKRQKWPAGAAVLRQMSTRVGLTNRADFRLRSAEFEINAGNLAAAQADLRQVVDEFGLDAAAVRAARGHLMQIAVRNHDYPAAQQYAEVLMQDCPPGEYGTLAYSLALFYYNQGDLAKAAATLEQAIAHPGLTSDQARNLQTFYARVLLDGGDHKRIREIFARLLTYPEAEMRPALSPALLFKAGEVCEQENDWSLAEQVWRRLAAYDHEPSWSYRGKIRLAQVCIVKGQLQESETLLAGLVAGLDAGLDGVTASRQELFSLLAETQLLRQQTDQALITAGKALAFTDGDERSLTRTRWVLAKILFEEENNPSQALSYAVKCFVLANDPVYTPRGMLLTVRIFLAQGRLREALSTWRELEGRYPAWAERERGSEDIKDMLAADGAGK